MMGSDSEIRVAVAHGRGAGRFLAMALVDALQSGMPLVAVHSSAMPGPARRSGLDFVFHQEGAEREEVIRAGLASDGRVVSAEIVRRHVRVHGAPCGAVVELLAAIRSGQAISEIHWQASHDEGTAGILSIVVRSERWFEVVCGFRGKNG